MPTFTFPPPPTTNQAYKLGMRQGRARLMKTPEMQAWQTGVALVVGPWRPPLHVPLRVLITMAVPLHLFRKIDCDSMVKILVDSTVGSRADQWVDEISVCKVVGTGEVEVQIETLGGAEC